VCHDTRLATKQILEITKQEREPRHAESKSLCGHREEVELESHEDYMTGFMTGFYFCPACGARLLIQSSDY
jgi:DNA-directed RNA polymerase subunit M/transcription elongation factor TFIIS